MEYEQQGDNASSLQFFEKCLEMAQRVEDTDKEAECYQQIANIYELSGDMHNAIEYLNKFQDICIASKNTEKLTTAYKRLSEVESKNGNVPRAIEMLQRVLGFANQGGSRAAQAEATLGLGLLFNQEGPKYNIKLAADYL